MSFFASLTTRRSLPFDSLRKSLHGNFLLSIFLRGATAILALAANVVLARVLGVTEYGHYMTLYSAAIVLGSLAIRGTDQLLTRELSAGGAGDTGWRREIGRWCRRRVTLGLIVAAGIYFVWSTFTRTSGAGWARLWIDASTVLLIGLFSVCTLLAGALNGFAASQRSQALGSLVNNCVVLLALGALWVLSVRGINGSVALWLQALGYLIACGIGWYWLRGLKISGLQGNLVLARQRSVQNRSSGWSLASRSFLFITIAAVLVNRLDVVLVSMLSDQYTAGIYVAGARLAQLALLVALSVNIVLSPRVSKAWSANDHTRAQRLLRGALVFTVTVSVLEVLVAIFFGSDIMRIFGSAYSGSTGVFILVVFAYALWTLAAPGYAFLSMTGSERMVAILSWLVAGVNVVAIDVLVPMYGATGGGWAMVAGYAIVIPCLLIALKKKFRHAR